MIENLRPTTNLVNPGDLMLSPEDNRRGFLYFYNSHYHINPMVYWLRVVMAQADPELLFRKGIGSDRKAMRDAFKELRSGISSYRVELRRVNGEEPHFIVKFPIVATEKLPTVLGLIYRGTRMGPDEDQSSIIRAALDNLENISTFDLDYIVSNAGRDNGQLRTAFDECLVDITKSDGIIYVELSIEPYEAEQLTGLPFAQIRYVDLYPMLRLWSDTYYGYTQRLPKTGMAISRIAATMRSGKDSNIRPKINEDSLSLTETGELVFIPASLDNAVEYERRYHDAGDKGDSFTLYSESGPKLPSNMPVLVDWQNGKYSYTSVGGDLVVVDTTRFRVPEAKHINRLLDKPIEERVIRFFANQAKEMGIPFNPFTDDQIEELPYSLRKEAKDLQAYFKAAAIQYNQDFMEQPTVGVIGDGSYALFEPVANIIGQVLNRILENIDAAYTRYSVSSVMYTILPYGLLIAKYARERGAIRTEARDQLKVYTEQGVDPEWGDEPLPLLSDSMGQMPHQLRARNLVRNFPQYAAFAIPAGGGKTPLILMDVLKFYKARIGWPYLIMCPSHLVAQYVSEIAYFTGGKLNAIPINTTTLNTNSLDRVGKIIQNQPRNTVVVVDYDVTSRILTSDIMYGTEPVTVFQVIEFLRQFHFNYAALDESHYLKTEDTARTSAVQALLSNIHYVRLASGTMADESMSDLAAQFGMFDPTVFGTREEFNQQYGVDVSGNRVTQWKPGAEIEVQSKIREMCVMVRAHRKEWAALLPQFKEYLHPVNLSPNQQAAYNELLGSVIAELEKLAATNSTIRAFLKGQSEDDDEEEVVNLENVLKPYLARLERFITAMGMDEWGKARLSGGDLVSPKVTKIVEIIRDHIAQNIPGKIVIFTNYTWSAETIYEQLPEDIKSRFLLYTAAQKTEIMAEFERDNILGMVGVSQSMDTGVNLQSASRLIREASVWNPGTLEQGNSRIQRPQLKREDMRNFIFLDWVLADNTIDVTKLMRLYSKTVNVAKYDNAGNPLYDTIETPEILKMTLDSIMEISTFDNEYSKECIRAYSTYRNAQDKEFAEYREKHGKLNLIPVPHAPDPIDAKIIHTVPYAPGGNLYASEQLGLVRLDIYLKSEDFDPSQNANEVVAGLRVHTELGEGIIRRVSPLNVVIELITRVEGQDVRGTITLRQSQVFVNTQRLIHPRLEIAAATGLPVQEEIPLPGSLLVRYKKASVENKVVENHEEADEPSQDVPTASIYPMIVNGFLALEYEPTSKDDPVARILQNHGFKPVRPYKYARVKTAAALTRQFKAWKEAGFTLDKSLSGISEQFKLMHDALKTHKVVDHQVHMRLSKGAELQNFMRMEFKPSSASKTLRPYPLIIDDAAYIALPDSGQTATRNAIKIRVPGVQWHDSEPYIQVFTSTTSKATSLIKQLIKAGVVIENMDEIKEALAHFKKSKPRVLDAGDFE